MTGLPGFLVACAHAAERAGLTDVDALELGVGKTAAALTLAAAVGRSRPAGVLLFGVAGAFPARHRGGPPPVAPGDLCVVVEEVFGDEGVDTPSGFRDLATLGLGDCGPFAAAAAESAAAVELLAAPRVRGVTVSTCSGTEAASRAMFERSGADVETMEGAAIAFACRGLGLPLVQLRAVSNWTGDRALGAWDLGAAVRRVQAAVRRLVRA